MKSDYSRDIFKQLEETMKRLDKMESTLENTKIEHKIEIGHLNDKINSLEKENAALKIENTRLKDDNERLRRIINNDSTNSPLPPSSDAKPVKAANEFNHRNSNSSAVQKRLCKLLVTAGRLRVVCTIFSIVRTPYHFLYSLFKSQIFLFDLFQNPKYIHSAVKTKVNTNVSVVIFLYFIHMYN